MCRQNRKKSQQDSLIPCTSGHRCVSQSCPPHPLGKDSLYNAHAHSRLPFLGNATGLLCCLFLPWAVMPAHPPMVVGSSQATYLGIYSFLSFLGTRQAQAAHSACPGLAWEAVLTFDVCHSPVAAGGQNCLTHPSLCPVSITSLSIAPAQTLL